MPAPTCSILCYDSGRRPEKENESWSRSAPPYGSRCASQRSCVFCVFVALKIMPPTGSGSVFVLAKKLSYSSGLLDPTFCLVLA